MIIKFRLAVLKGAIIVVPNGVPFRGGPMIKQARKLDPVIGPAAVMITKLNLDILNCFCNRTNVRDRL